MEQHYISENIKLSSSIIELIFVVLMQNCNYTKQC